MKVFSECGRSMNNGSWLYVPPYVYLLNRQRQHDCVIYTYTVYYVQQVPYQQDLLRASHCLLVGTLLGPGALPSQPKKHHNLKSNKHRSSISTLDPRLDRYFLLQKTFYFISYNNLLVTHLFFVKYVWYCG